MLYREHRSSDCAVASLPAPTVRRSGRNGIPDARSRARLREPVLVRVMNEPAPRSRPRLTTTKHAIGRAMAGCQPDAALAGAGDWVGLLCTSARATCAFVHVLGSSTRVRIDTKGNNGPKVSSDPSLAVLSLGLRRVYPSPRRGDRGRKDRLVSIPPPSEPCRRFSRTRLSGRWSYL
jgi:hypothetical protein